jgi:hypothetical protein
MHVDDGMKAPTGVTALGTMPAIIPSAVARLRVD